LKFVVGNIINNTMKEKINSKLLRTLGFKKNHVPPEVSGSENPFHYWTLDLSDVNKNFCLITNVSDELEEQDVWSVFLFETDEFKITDSNLLRMFICTLNVIKNENSQLV